MPKHGPVLTPMNEVFGNPDEHGATGGSVTNGIGTGPYPKGDATKLPEVTFDNCGEFGKVPAEK